MAKKKKRNHVPVSSWPTSGIRKGLLIKKAYDFGSSWDFGPLVNVNKTQKCLFSDNKPTSGEMVAATEDSEGHKTDVILRPFWSLCCVDW